MPLEEIEAGWTGHYELKGKLADADCVIGPSFGFRGKPGYGHAEPGLSNQDLAAVAAKYYGKLPKILQFELADAYQAHGKRPGEKVYTIKRHRKRGKYLDTREVLEQAKIIMQEHGFKTAVLLAHPNHMPRVQMCCDVLGINWVATPELRGAVEFDPLSAQKWTRSIDQWRGYEPLALAFYRMKGFA